MNSYTHAITFLSSLALVSALAMISFRTIRLCIRTYAAQSFLIGAAAVLTGAASDSLHIAVVAATVTAVKAFVIPWFLFRVMDKLSMGRETKRKGGNFVSLAMALFMALVSYAAVAKAFHGDGTAAKGFSTGLAVMFSGMLLTAGSKKAITQIIGLMVMENGLFAA